MHVTRPTRGAVRLDDMTWDVSPLRRDLARFGEDDWRRLPYGEAWGQILLVKPGRRGAVVEHPKLAQCDGLQAVLDAFPGRVLDATLARLGPGGWIKEHRDLSGGASMGVARFHVPIVTDAGVEFAVSGDPVRMGPGETWTLDTTWPHRVHNRGNVWRVHLIVDVELTPEIAALLPPPDLVDRLHQVHFALVCLARGAELAVKDPGQLRRRVSGFVRLRLLKQSVMEFPDEAEA